MKVFEQIVETGEDVFVVRQRGRYVAEVAGFDTADQVRIATALSELGRDVLTGPGGGRAWFEIDDTGRSLVVTVAGLDAGQLRAGTAVAAARRLMTGVAIEETPPSAKVVMTRPLPQLVTEFDALRIRDQLAQHVVISPLDELRGQNRELISALDQLGVRQTELMTLNDELEETNRGVMAMYNQLSDELETTNRGVVALYAELDDTSRQLRATTEAKTRFLSSVSHELRAPVSSVLGLARLLGEPTEGALTVEQRRQVDLIIKSASELLDLVSELLDLAKAESGRLQPVLTSVEVTLLVAEEVDSLRPLAAAGVVVDVRVPSSPLFFRTDSALLRQVVRNLVTNALAFTGEGEVVVSVFADTTGRLLVVEVADTGIGIAADHLDLIFEEFFQVRGPAQARRRGTGLGLPYARRVAEVLGGELSVASQVGQGTVFTLRLPGDETAELPTEMDPASLRVGRVLIVDDDPGYRAILTGLLRPFADQLTEVDDGEAALAHLLEHGVDVVFLDLAMPGMSGSDVLDEMASQPALRDIPVIVVTSMELRGDARTALGRIVALLPKQNMTSSKLYGALAALPQVGHAR